LRTLIACGPESSSAMVTSRVVALIATASPSSAPTAPLVRSG
jgi:hypothetical protein